MKKIQLTFAGLFFLMLTYAGNPLTTNFSNFYSSVEQVNLAEKYGQLDGELASYLLDGSVSTENKAAVINALYVDSKADYNATSFRQYLARRLKVDWQNIDLSQLTGDELFCLGYLTVMDNPSESQAAFVILEQAKEKSNSSFTVNLFYSLVQAQIFADDNNNCAAFKVCEDVRNDEALVSDFNEAAINVIFESVNDYQEKCN